jgi:hypothetical protein
MTSKELEEIPTKLAPLVTPHPSTSAHNIIYKRGKNTSWGPRPNPTKTNTPNKKHKKKAKKIVNEYNQVYP